jgi:hypothetical protein
VIPFQISSDSPLAGDEVVRAVMVSFMAVGTLERADIWVRNKRIRAFSRHPLTSLHGKLLPTGLALDEPHESHLLTHLTDRIFTFWCCGTSIEH